MIFWIGLLVGAAILALVFWLRSRNIHVKWYEWLIGAVGFLLLIIAVQHYVGSMAEYVSQSAWMGLLAFGIPALILFAVAGQLIARRQRAG